MGEKRYSNYDIMRDRMELEFAKYDQPKNCVVDQEGMETVYFAPCRLAAEVFLLYFVYFYTYFFYYGIRSYFNVNGSHSREKCR